MLSTKEIEDAQERGGRREAMRHQNAHYNVLASELFDLDEKVSPHGPISDRFWRSVAINSKKKDDPYHDYTEEKAGKETTIPSLKECRAFLRNDEADSYHHRSRQPVRIVANTIMDFTAAVWMYIVNTMTPESVFAVANGVIATYIYCRNAEDWSVKLDFSFLAFSIVFPLTFLIQSVFSRRDQALQRLADFKGALLAGALLTLSVDWATASSPSGGRSKLPLEFNKAVVDDFRNVVLLVYQYLSMPQVSHARNVVRVLVPRCYVSWLSCEPTENSYVKLLHFLTGLSTETKVDSTCTCSSEQYLPEDQ